MAPSKSLLLRFKHRTPDLTLETAANIRRLSQQKLMSRRCSLHQALLIQSALPHLDRYMVVETPTGEASLDSLACDSVDCSDDFDDVEQSKHEEVSPEPSGSRSRIKCAQKRIFHEDGSNNLSSVPVKSACPSPCSSPSVRRRPSINCRPLTA
jgi:hypothetical protein